MPFERKNRDREAGPLMRGTKKLSSHADNFSSGANLGISINSNQLTSAINSITATNRIVCETSAAANFSVSVSAIIYLSAGDIIRAHSDGASSGTVPAVTTITIVRVA